MRLWPPASAQCAVHESDLSASPATPAPAAAAPERSGLTDADKVAVQDAYRLLREATPTFRRRPTQARMIGAAATALATPGAVSVIEAPTGVGKSLAYLTAGATLAQRYKIPLIISTGTVALQEQLAMRDIPAFLKATNLGLRAVVAKGRGRYACTRQLQQLASNAGQEGLDFGADTEGFELSAAWPRAPGPGEVDRVTRLLQALEARKWDGDLDVPPEPISPELAPLLGTSAGGCTNKQCEFYRRCPFFLARDRIDGADLVVTNHSLLMADMRLAGDDGEPGGVLLPHLSRALLVVDEGHHLPDVAIDAQAVELHVSAAAKRLSRAGRTLQLVYASANKDTIGKVTAHEGLAGLSRLVSLLGRFQQLVSSSWTPGADEDPPTLRFRLGQVPDDWRGHVSELADLSGRMATWSEAVLRRAREITAPGSEKLAREAGLVAERLASVSMLWSMWRANAAGGAPIAKWVTLAKDGGMVLHAGAVSAAEFLSTTVFQPKASVVITSATLSAGGNFEPTRLRTGLPATAECLALPSPFDIRSNGTLQVPAMRTTSKDREAHTAEVASWLVENLDWAAGNIVIFTALAKMRAVAARLPDNLRTRVRMQGEGSRASQLEAHSRDLGAGLGSTLFGSLGMGEGLDLVGKLCTTVVIVSLPFSVPTTPIAATHSEWLESRGLRPFDEVSVPDAIRVLTQHSGRLLRHEDDTGRIVILDRRIADTGYGKRMLDALPPFRRIIERKPR